MAENRSRQVHELASDYAEALRDGRVGSFVKGLNAQEITTLCKNQEFGQASQMVQALNQLAFAPSAIRPQLDLFIARVDANIASRLKSRANLSEPAPHTSSHTGSQGS